MGKESILGSSAYFRGLGFFFFIGEKIFGIFWLQEKSRKAGKMVFGKRIFQGKELTKLQFQRILIGTTWIEVLENSKH